MPPQKRSIHIGVNTVDPDAYKPKVPSMLTAAEADAAAMHALTEGTGLVGTLLIGQSATRGGFHKAMQLAAASLTAGDLLVLTFSGHGARFSDSEPGTQPRPAGAINREPNDDDDGFDECWCLWDGVLIDDDLHALLVRFAPGVRIYALSDSCYSGTILRRSDYPPPTRSTSDVQASVLLSAAAAESELCFTNEICGHFTGAVLAVWDEGRFTGDHLEFHEAVRTRSAPGQVPDLVRYGVRDSEFERARPFGAA